MCTVSGMETSLFWLMNEAILLYSEKSGRTTLMEAESHDSDDLLVYIYIYTYIYIYI